MSYRFIADVHLGKLARLLRLLGFDTWYSNVATPPQLSALAAQQDRVLLTRSAHIRNSGAMRVLRINSESAPQQLEEVMQAFPLRQLAKPFTRCLVCNGWLNRADKTAIVDLLEPNTARYYDDFWRCSECGRIYWKGSHYQRMLQLVRGYETQ